MPELINNFEELLEPVTETPEVEEPPTEESSTVEETTEVSEPEFSDNSIYQFLQEHGIKDPSKIQFTNEDESVEELDFNSLTPSEQLDILRTITDPGLTEDEINTINYLRKYNVNFNQAIDYFSEQRLKEYLNEHPEAAHKKTYTIDDYSNDDLYLIDLKNRYPDLTDEELLSELEIAKSNEELFNKKTETLRNIFKANEDQAAEEQARLEQQQVEDLRNNLMNAAGKFNEVQLDYTDDKSDSLVISDEDKQQMMSYILDQDSDGKSQLVRDLEDPDRLIEIAWFSVQGPQILSELTQYWKGLLAQERNENKKLQSEIAKLGKKASTVVVSSPKTESTSGESIWDNSGLL